MGSPGLGQREHPRTRIIFGGVGMFGAFTNEEVDTLVTWIDALGPENSTWLYYRFTLRIPVASRNIVSSLQDPACHHPVLAARGVDKATMSGFVAEFPDC